MLNKNYLQTLLFCLILTVPLSSFSQDRITTDKDTLDQVKIKSNPYFTNKEFITTKDKVVLEASEVTSYTDGGKFYLSTDINGEKLFLRQINIGPYSIFAAINSDGSRDAYLYANNSFTLLDRNNIYNDLRSNINFESGFTEVKKIKSPEEAAEFLAMYNNYLYPDKYKIAKFKSPDDKIQFKAGVGATYTTISQDNFDLAETTNFSATPMVGIRGDYGLIGVNLEFYYYNSSLQNGNLRSNIRTLLVPIYLNLDVFNKPKHTISLLGGYNVAINVKSKFINYFNSSTQGRSDIIYEAPLKSAPYYGISYIHKTDKNRKYEFNYTYFNSTIDVEKPETTNFAPETIDVSFHSLTLKYIVSFW